MTNVIPLWRGRALARNLTLFNLEIDYRAPEWRLLTGTMVLPIQDDGNGELLPLSDADKHLATGWIVYGITRDGDFDPITRCTTERFARGLASLFETLIAQSRR